MMRIKSQKYSDIVFRKVQNLINEEEKFESVKRYKSLCKRAGGVLRTVGLIQFLTFLAAKATRPSEIHHQFLLDHLRYELDSCKIIRSADNLDLLQKIQNQDLHEYMRATSEVLKFLQWHKRISDILIIDSNGSK